MNLFVGSSTKKKIEWKVQKVERKETRAEVCGNRHRALSRQSWVQEHTDDGVRSLLRSCCSTNHPRRGYILMYLGSFCAPFTCFYSCFYSCWLTFTTSIKSAHLEFIYFFNL